MIFIDHHHKEVMASTDLFLCLNKLRVGNVEEKKLKQQVAFKSCSFFPENSIKMYIPSTVC